jgi:hypothetical protein
VRDDIVLRSLGFDMSKRCVVAFVFDGYRASAAEPFVVLVCAQADELYLAFSEREQLAAA